MATMLQARTAGVRVARGGRRVRAAPRAAPVLPTTGAGFQCEWNGPSLSDVFGLIGGCGTIDFANMMRHGKRLKKLSLPADQRKALLRGLTTQLLTHGRIKTTKGRAKAVRKFAEHI